MKQVQDTLDICESECMFFFVHVNTQMCTMATLTQCESVAASTAVGCAKAPIICLPAVCSAGG